MSQREEPKIHPVTQHGKLTEVFKDIFVVQGTSVILPGCRIPRSMIVVRDGRALSLISTVRLSDEGLEELDSLGDVENIIEIAGFHGKDDWFYVKRYPDATVYAAEGHPHKVGVETDVVLNEDTKLPFPDARVFSFEAPVMPEHAIFIDRDGGILITGDAVQNMLDAQDCSLLGAAASYGMGFVHPVNIGPGWIMEQTKKGYTGPPLWEAFERLLEDVPFTQLLPSHGKPVTDGSAATGLRATLERIGRENLTGAPVEGRPKLLYILVAAVCVGTVWAVNTLSSAAAGGAGVGAGAEL